MMKRIVPYVLCTVCMSVCLGGLHDADDGYLTAGEYGIDVLLDDTDQLIVMGGGASRITADNHSYIEVQYTSTPLSNNTGIYDIMIGGFSELFYQDGVTDLLSVYDDATSTITGGNINLIRSYQTVGWLAGQPVGQHIDIFVRDYSYNPSTFMLTGHWEDFTTFNIKLLNQSGYDKVIDNIKFTIIPEPATLTLLGLGGLLIRKRKF